MKAMVTPNKTSIFTGALAVLGLIFFTHPTLAQIERQHEAHVHGQATGTFAMDGEDWELALEIPGFNLLGFEHKPENRADQQKLVSVTHFLNQGEWLMFNAQADCEIRDIGIRLEGYGTIDGSSHGHDHHAHEGGHAKVSIEMNGRCKEPNDLQWGSIALFADFPNNKEIEVAVLTRALVFEAHLKPNNHKIVFDR
jgi:hypothetical protein